MLRIHTGIVIVESPSNVTVFTNQTAVFTCEIHGDFIYQYWRMNETAFDSLPRKMREDMILTQKTVGENEELNLTISGRAEYNGTTVQCVVGGGEGKRESEYAILNIQGIYCYVLVHMYLP